MERVRVAGDVELAVGDAGEGPAVVLLPGLFLDHRIWDRQVPALIDAGFRVVRVDPRGHGTSDKTPTGYDVPRLARDLIEVLDVLEVYDATVVGHSFSGQVAFHAAVRAPERVGALVLVSSNAVSASRTDGFPFGAPADALIPALVEGEEHDRLASRRTNLVTAFATPPDDPTTEWLLEMSLQTPTATALQCYRALLEFDQTADRDRITVPVLQINGADDPILSARGADWLAQELGSEVTRIPGAGHYPMLETPEAVAAQLCRFVRQRVDAPPAAVSGAVSEE